MDENSHPSCQQCRDWGLSCLDYPVAGVWFIWMIAKASCASSVVYVVTPIDWKLAAFYGLFSCQHWSQTITNSWWIASRKLFLS